MARNTDKGVKASKLSRLSLFFYEKPKFAILLWVVLVGFGLLCYTSLLERQGFPPVQAPLSVVSGSYIVNDPAKVDEVIAKPISAAALANKDVKTITTTAGANTFTGIIQYQDGVDAAKASESLETSVKSKNLPPQAHLFFKALEISKYSTSRGDSYDILIAFYGKGDTSNLTDKAKDYAQALRDKNLNLVSSVKVVDPYIEGTNGDGNTLHIQTTFDRYGERKQGTTTFHNDVVIGLVAKPNSDTVKVYEQVQSAVNQLNKSADFKNNYQAAVTAAFGPDIKQEISELQRTLLEGLAAVLILGTILITLRASILIILSMISVITITLGAIYLIGYTLNVITLFSLILGLSLIVDDTIIMTEALDVEKRRRQNARESVKFATRKVSLAMLAATSTAALGFAPIIFITGILGGFIRPIPITIITSLIVSLFVALTIIPLFARILILRKGSFGDKAKVPMLVRLQESFAHKLTAPLRWTQHSTKRLWALGTVAIIVGFGFIFAGGYIFKYLEFNIFPSNKDSNKISIDMQFPAGTDLPKAEKIADDADNVVAKTLGKNLHQTNYYATADSSKAQLFIDLIPYTERSITSQQLIANLKNSFANFKEAAISISQQDVGGPPGSFNVLIETSDRENGYKLANNIVNYLQGRTLTRADGSKAHIVKALISDPDSYQRKDNKQFIQVASRFDATDTSTLVDLAKKETQKEYTAAKLSQYNLKPSNIVYDFGFENENQKSFKSMIIAFPILLAVMFVLLAIEFKSLLQPLLIFMAIPFSFFGVTGGLWLTNNPFSFFTMLGFFALVGLSIKNTILLTDYANQARRAGLGRVDSISSAVEERFRPLLATSVTAVFSLLPLALTSPFWEALAFTLIFGLISSTVLVLLVFPYYYLAGEYLRLHISRKAFFVWLLANVVLFSLVKMAKPHYALLALVFANILYALYRWFSKNK